MKNTCRRILLENKTIPANNLKRGGEQRKENKYLITGCGNRVTKNKINKE
jgi:hypothetical protein